MAKGPGMGRTPCYPRHGLDCGTHSMSLWQLGSQELPPVALLWRGKVEWS